MGRLLTKIIHLFQIEIGIGKILTSLIQILEQKGSQDILVLIVWML